mmetsp:Transcript_13975/g.23101  ORF Transcript_13975/g.23101 Transcript_13975/m.23101 type:complete len:1129 (-) Transcript_13975:266-3652(-)|eukprot:CAMPEP_0184647274 /NCGR_PEP_ID=MMETSP0308-20130426/4161_1 /TAXON_ID=38269 /ORGANISM="Gloeochaete witrockiana, Strain SAG 46.84" /LENGTH=1128 /DNA_ID=CAMNT_0027078093 /DNA_START=66 /DNA_END=3452 /DNA_ORIENTATION=+
MANAAVPTPLTSADTIDSQKPTIRKPSKYPEVELLLSFVRSSKDFFVNLIRYEEISANARNVRTWITEREAKFLPLVDCKTVWDKLRTTPTFKDNFERAEKHMKSVWRTNEGSKLWNVLSLSMGWKSDSAAWVLLSEAVTQIIISTEVTMLSLNGLKGFLEVMDSPTDFAFMWDELEGDLAHFFRTATGRRFARHNRVLLGSTLDTARDTLLRVLSACLQQPYDVDADINLADLQRVFYNAVMHEAHLIDFISKALSPEVLVPMLRNLTIPPMSGNPSSPFGPAQFEIKNVNLSGLSMSFKDMKVRCRGHYYTVTGLSFTTSFRDVVWKVHFPERAALSTDGLIDIELVFSPITFPLRVYAPDDGTLPEVDVSYENVRVGHIDINFKSTKMSWLYNICAALFKGMLCSAVEPVVNKLLSTVLCGPLNNVAALMNEKIIVQSEIANEDEIIDMDGEIPPSKGLRIIRASEVHPPTPTKPQQQQQQQPQPQQQHEQPLPPPSTKLTNGQGINLLEEPKKSEQNNTAAHAHTNGSESSAQKPRRSLTPKDESPSSAFKAPPEKDPSSKTALPLLVSPDTTSHLNGTVPDQISDSSNSNQIANHLRAILAGKANASRSAVKSSHTSVPLKEAAPVQRSNSSRDIPLNAHPSRSTSPHTSIADSENSTNPLKAPYNRATASTASTTTRPKAPPLSVSIPAESSSSTAISPSSETRTPTLTIGASFTTSTTASSVFMYSHKGGASGHESHRRIPLMSKEPSSTRTSATTSPVTDITSPRSMRSSSFLQKNPDRGSFKSTPSSSRPGSFRQGSSAVGSICGDGDSPSLLQEDNNNHSPSLSTATKSPSGSTRSSFNRGKRSRQVDPLVAASALRPEKSVLWRSPSMNGMYDLRELLFDDSNNIPNLSSRPTATKFVPRSMSDRSTEAFSLPEFSEHSDLYVNPPPPQNTNTLSHLSPSVTLDRRTHSEVNSRPKLGHDLHRTLSATPALSQERRALSENTRTFSGRFLDVFRTKREEGDVARTNSMTSVASSGGGGGGGGESPRAPEPVTFTNLFSTMFRRLTIKSQTNGGPTLAVPPVTSIPPPASPYTSYRGSIRGHGRAVRSPIPSFEQDKQPHYVSTRVSYGGVSVPPNRS